MPSLFSEKTNLLIHQWLQISQLTSVPTREFSYFEEEKVNACRIRDIRPIRV